MVAPGSPVRETRGSSSQSCTLPPCSMLLGLMNVGRHHKADPDRASKSSAAPQPEDILNETAGLPSAPENVAKANKPADGSIQSDAVHGASSAEADSTAFYDRVADYNVTSIMSDSSEQGVFTDDALHHSSSVASSADDSVTDSASSRLDTDDDSDTLPTGPWPITDEEKAQRVADLQKEFGELNYLKDKEKYIFDVPGVLFTGVIIKGTIVLTTHRLAYYAIMPDLEKLQEKTKVPKTTVATMHYASATKSKVRGYFVLREDGVSVYHDSKHLHDPIGSVHFSNILEVYNGPLETRPITDPRYCTFTFINRMGGKRKKVLCRIECDDEETANYMLNEIAAATFIFNNKLDRLRASIPLDRIENVETVDFLGHATMLSLHLDRSQLQAPKKAQKDKKVQKDNITLAVLNVVNWVQPLIQQAILQVRKEIPGQPVSTGVILEVATPHQTGVEKKRGSSEVLASRPNIVSQPSTGTTASDAMGDDLRDDGEDDDDSDPDEPNVPQTTEARATKYAARYAADSDQADRFAFAFGLEPLDILFVLPAALARGIPTIGKMAITKRGVCFLRKSSVINDVRLIVKKEELKHAQRFHSMFAKVYGIKLIIQGHPEINFHLYKPHVRDWAIEQIELLCSKTVETPMASPATTLNEDKKELSIRSPIASWSSRDYSKHIPAMHVSRLGRVPAFITEDLTPAVMRHSRLRVCCLTIGSRGDVQPYIALCLGLQKDGHKTCIATHPEYKNWVESYGIEHRPVGGDPGILMEISVQHKIFNPETIKAFRSWFDDLLKDSFGAVKGQDLLVESPSTFAGVHIAESLKIPYFRAFTMPWTRTGDFPHPFMTAGADLTRAYNYSSYLLFDQILWRASSSQINRWRKHTLGLQSTDSEHLHLRRIPFIYNFSEAVCPRPNDWASWIHVSGYWFLETQTNEWEPPESLLSFIEKAKEDKKPLVYCGFGSITIADPQQLTRDVVAAVAKADVRMILSKGWSARRQSGKSESISLPETIYEVESIPHDWLFDKVAAAMHHGGAGTTAASLRAGVPTLIKPFFGDQSFWAQRVHKLGAGLRVKSLSADDMADAWITAVNDRVMKEKAALVGERLRKENGVRQAIDFIYAYYEKAAEERGGSGEMPFDGTNVSGSGSDADSKRSHRSASTASQPYNSNEENQKKFTVLVGPRDSAIAEEQD